MPVIKCKLADSVIIYNKDLVNLYGCEIGENTTVGPFVEIQKNVLIGKNCKISSHSFICSGVSMSDNIFIGHNVVFINDRQPEATNKDGTLKSDTDWLLEKTIIESNVSIGSGSIIMCGVTIKKNTKIGAGSLVLKDIENNKTFFNKRTVVLK